MKKFKMLSIIIIILLIAGFIYYNYVSASDSVSNGDVYDIILFWRTV